MDLKDLYAAPRPVVSETEAKRLEEQWRDDVITHYPRTTTTTAAAVASACVTNHP